MSKTTDTPTRRPNPTSPIEIERLEALRGDPQQLAGMRDVIARTFGITIDTRRLELRVRAH